MRIFNRTNKRWKQLEEQWKKEDEKLQEYWNSLVEQDKIFTNALWGYLATRFDYEFHVGKAHKDLHLGFYRSVPVIYDESLSDNAVFLVRRK